jgi:hypothetical protein
MKFSDLKEIISDTFELIGELVTLIPYTIKTSSFNEYTFLGKMIMEILLRILVLVIIPFILIVIFFLLSIMLMGILMFILMFFIKPIIYPFYWLLFNKQNRVSFSEYMQL